MCVIVGFTQKTRGREEVLACLDRAYTRGPDMARVAETASGWLGFRRLSIMGLDERGMQPFALGPDQVVCNGELYGWRRQRAELEQRGYTFRSGSDCELLLPMYREYGLDMFARLDAEFALILYDGEADEYVAARDANPARPGLSRSDDMDTVCQNIHDKLIAAVDKRLDADAPLGFLLSGGLDSSLVCAIAARLLGKPIRTFAIGMDTDAIDLKYARKAAQFIGADHTEVTITRDDVIAALPKVVAALGTWDITTIRASVGMYLCCKAIRETTDIRVLLTGEISDELFGYKYTDFAPSPAAFQTEAEKRVEELYMYDVLRADRCISGWSMEARVPFGDLDFVEYVMSVDPALKVNRCGKGKYLLRRAFQSDALLPDEILWREKAAFSDAVGHSMVDDLKEYARAQYSDLAFTRGCAQYQYRPPFTRESLLYRDLFERYYPGQARMIKDFWMPNRAWEGCNVDDPSARALKNYGASGF